MSARPSLSSARVLALIWLLSSPLHSQAQDPWEAETLSIEAIEQRAAQTRERLEKLPADATEGSPEAQLRQALSRQLELLETLESTVTTRAEIKADREALLTPADAGTGSDEPPQAPEAPTQEGFDALTNRLEEARKRVTQLEGLSSTAQKRLEELPAKIETQKTALNEAEQLIETKKTEREAASDETREVLSVQLDNAEIQRRTIQEQVQNLEARLELAKLRGEQLPSKIDTARSDLDWIRQAHSLYSGALQEALAAKQEEAERELAAKQEQARLATGPEKLLARREAAIAEVQKNLSQLEPFKVQLTEMTAEQKKLADLEAAQLENIKDLVERAGDSDRAAEMLKSTFQRLPQRRRTLERSQSASVIDSLNLYRARNFEIDDIRFELASLWRGELEQVLSQIDEAERPAFEARATALREQYQTALAKEKAVLTDILALGQQIETAYFRRIELLEELESFVLSKVFWVRDAPPLSPDMVQEIPQEVSKIASWWSRVGLPEIERWIRDQAQTLLSAILAFFLFPVLPIILILIRSRLRRFARTRIGRDRESHRPSTWIMPMLVGIAGAILMPLYIVVAAGLVETIDQDTTVGQLIIQLLYHLAIFALIWSLARLFFGPGMLAETQWGLKADTVARLFSSARMIALGHLLWLLPWMLLGRHPFDQPPYELSVLPRLGYTIFEITVALVVFRLIRPSSPLTRDLLAGERSGRARRYWSFISAVAVLMMLGILGLDVAGYRYGSARFAESFLLTLGLAIVLPGVYSLASGTLQHFLKRRRRVATSAPGEEQEAQPRHVASAQVQRFVRLGFIILALVLLASFWGIDQRAFNALDEFPIFDVSADESVTAADLLKFGLILLTTFWILRFLPGIYEFAVFPRFQFDVGLRYAILTMSRYGIFFLGAVFALSAIHLDLEKISWLVAAIGVGLGFGLQEIVSNFISGLILLVERPIRIGDLVTVGDVTGNVQRINIRSTTIQNFDRQEVIVPNRSLITQDVTNWTLSNKMSRLTVKIGVAYGSSIDLVRSLLFEIARNEQKVLEDPEPQVFFMSHGDSSLDFELRVFLADSGDRLVMLDRLNSEVNRALEERGIEIPFPQRDIHIRSQAAVEVQSKDDGESIDDEGSDHEEGRLRRTSDETR